MCFASVIVPVVESPAAAAGDEPATAPVPATAAPAAALAESAMNFLRLRAAIRPVRPFDPVMMLFTHVVLTPSNAEHLHAGRAVWL
ncbi:hypothetical protein GCM10023235_28880 [Kitasatospora terrestris]|uniref:Uncharacterized protein n=1 Tax=Kitasatospora terrestris TaxID=258051 RepID=A0ABP9DKK3_9ACTN